MSAIPSIRAVKNAWLRQVMDTSGLTQKAFADKLGMRDDQLGHVAGDRRPVSDQFIDRVCRKFKVSFPLDQPTLYHPVIPRAVTVDRDGRENVVVVETRAKAGYLGGMGDPEYLGKLPAYRLPYLGMGTFRDFTVEGFSMFNPETGQIMDGSHVIARSIDLEGLRSAHVHVVVTTDDLLIKRIYREGDTLRLKSDNPDKIAYPDITLRLADVNELWYVERLVTTSIPPRSTTDEMEEMRRALDQMRKELDTIKQGKRP